MAKNPENSQINFNRYGILVADHVSAMLAYWDKNLVCRFANAAYMDWFGKTRDEMVDKMTLSELLGPLYEKNLPYILGALEGNIQTFEREIPVPAGGTRHAIANYFPDILNGEVKGFVVHVVDITSLKLLEKELLQSNKIISEQNKRLLNFANIVSHNLRSYAYNLESILYLFTNAQSIEEKNEAFDYLKNISKRFSSTIDHLNELVDLRHLSDLKLERINLHEYIEKAIVILAIQIKSTNATILNNVSADIMLSANPAYIESILLNFLSNAIKYRSPYRDPVIEFSSAIKGDELLLKIKDNGLGINLEKYSNDLFCIYKTFHGNPDAKGVGLFITKFQVESMGGRIEVESKETKGTTFTIYLKL
ncbi:PAS domain S-box protein [Panacibacter ginsenosidivorans]|uniref:histidine kinase n=1 Tax=Panacibacter ginsenosidivorans TaxID=1813871 RepID=A0A5B8VER0_9BACT|nr:PAS domain-containing sensor histidine kinase [Panacibacter ginsenosidivorans]QEC70037.1 PAS domain S-box protein [Panacibacter ginsenosidivorans]